MVFDKIETRKKLNFKLEKMDIASSVRLQVGFAMDVSYSMIELYKDGYMQLFNNRIFPIAERFDDNQSMDMALFDSQVHEVDDMVPSNYENYIKETVLSAKGIWKNTEFASVINYFYNKWFGEFKTTEVIKRPNTGGFFSRFFLGDTIDEKIEKIEMREHQPSYLIFQTDGENADTVETERLIASIQDKDIYISFIGVGDCSFKFIKHLADKYSNVGFYHINDLKTVTDDEIYDGLITSELSEWLKKRTSK